MFEGGETTHYAWIGPIVEAIMDNYVYNRMIITTTESVNTSLPIMIVIITHMILPFYFQTHQSITSGR